MLDGLPSSAENAVSMVDLKIFDDPIVIYRQLRSFNVFFHFLAELFKVPIRVQINFKLDLLGTWISLIVALITLRHLINIVFQVLVLNLHSHKQLDTPSVRIIVPWNQRRGWVVLSWLFLGGSSLRLWLYSLFLL